MNTKKVLDFLKKPIVLGLSGIILGIIIGLVIGWGIWPVQWTDASAENLRPDLQRDYLRNAILAYEKTGDQVKAIQHYKELGKNAEITLSELTTDPGYISTEQVLKFSQAVSAQAVVIAQPSAQPTEQVPEAVKTGKPNAILWFGLALFLLLLAAASLVYYFIIKGRSVARHQPLSTEIPETNIYTDQALKSGNMAVTSKEKPIAQFMTTYMFGDDMYDEMFTFEAPNGEFLGECGVGISDTIGVGEPKKISAFEVWLFDKNDVQTVTKLFLSNHVFNEPNLRQRLESKGEPILAETGKQILLETATLQLEARIVDLSYGEIPLPENSYFQRFTMELAVWRK